MLLDAYKKQGSKLREKTGWNWD